MDDVYKHSERLEKAGVPFHKKPDVRAVNRWRSLPLACVRECYWSASVVDRWCGGLRRLRVRVIQEGGMKGLAFALDPDMCTLGCAAAMEAAPSVISRGCLGVAVQCAAAAQASPLRRDCGRDRLGGDHQAVYLGLPKWCKLATHMDKLSGTPRDSRCPARKAASGADRVAVPWQRERQRGSTRTVRVDQQADESTQVTTLNFQCVCTHMVNIHTHDGHDRLCPVNGEPSHPRFCCEDVALDGGVVCDADLRLCLLLLLCRAARGTFLRLVRLHVCVVIVLHV